MKVATRVRPIGEEFFESYLRSQGLTWEYEPVIGRRRPDYLVHRAEVPCLIEMEGLDRPGVGAVGGFSPCVAIRNALRRARNQLREFKFLPLGIALYTDSAIRALNPHTASSAAFGPGFNDSRSRDRLDPRPSARRFAKRWELPPDLQDLADPFLSRDVNTSISAIVVLSKYELSEQRLEIWRRLYRRQQDGGEIRPLDGIRLAIELKDALPSAHRYAGTPRVVVIENRHARIPFPDELFRGPFDQRWGWKEDWCGPLWIGQELMALYEQGVPFEQL